MVGEREVPFWKRPVSLTLGQRMWLATVTILATVAGSGLWLVLVVGGDAELAVPVMSQVLAVSLPIVLVTFLAARRGLLGPVP